MGLSETRFSLIFSMNTLCITIVSVIAAALADKVSYRRRIAIGLIAAVLAAVAPIVGLGGEDTAVPMGISMVVFAVLAAISYLTLTRKSTAAPARAEQDNHLREGTPQPVSPA